jgi:hypothetical protein
MVMDTKTEKKICDFVKLRPRTVHEISLHIKRNWRTAERYIEKIEQETGCISKRIFREGTRGALKIVYWNFSEDIHSTSFQQELLDKIMGGMRKPDFSPFDIYQYVSKKKKKLYVEDVTKLNPEVQISKDQDFVGLLRQATKQVLIFSGNLSWVNAKQGRIKIIDVIRELVNRGVSVKIIGRVSLIGVDNVKKLIAINKEPGRDLIDIRHRYQPLRAMIIDGKIIRFREVRDPGYYDKGELGKKLQIFYEIRDAEWIDWLQKIFWKMFSAGMPAEKRVSEIESVKKMIA